MIYVQTTIGTQYAAITVKHEHGVTRHLIPYYDLPIHVNVKLVG